MKEIAIDTAALDRDIGSLKEKLGDLRAAEQKMTEDVRELSTMWKGTANDAFVAQYRADRETFNEMYTILEELIAALEYARDQYDKCDGQVNELVNSIRL